MKAQGHDVTVIAGFPNYPSGTFPAEYQGKWTSHEILDEVPVFRTRVFASTKGGALRRLLNYFSFMFTSFLAGLFLRKKFDVVVASCPPLFLGVSGWLVARLRGAKFVFDIRDLWPDVAVEAGEFKEDSLITRLGHALAMFIYRRSDHIIPVTENKKKRLLEKNIPEDKITVVSNGVDLDLVPPLENHPTLRESLGLEDKFVAVYAGLLGIAQRVEIVVEAAQHLGQIPGVHFVIIGDGVRKPVIEQAIQDSGLTNVSLLPRQPREQMPTILATADVCMVPLSSANLVDAVPSKLLEAWSYHKPAILIAAGESADLVNQCDGGRVVAPGDDEGVALAIQELVHDRDLARKLGENGYLFVRDHLDRPKLAEEMASVLQQVCGHEAPSHAAAGSQLHA